MQGLPFSCQASQTWDVTLIQEQAIILHNHRSQPMDFPHRGCAFSDTFTAPDGLDGLWIVESAQQPHSLLLSILY